MLSVGQGEKLCLPPLQPKTVVILASSHASRRSGAGPADPEDTEQNRPAPFFQEIPTKGSSPVFHSYWISQGQGTSCELAEAPTDWASRSKPKPDADFFPTLWMGSNHQIFSVKWRNEIIVNHKYRQITVTKYDCGQVCRFMYTCAGVWACGGQRRASRVFYLSLPYSLGTVSLSDLNMAVCWVGWQLWNQRASHLIF